MFTPAARALIGALLLLVCPVGTQAVPTATPAASPGRRRALLIGIDDYSAGRRAAGMPAARLLPPLRGAVRDVEGMREMLLARYDFKAGDIVLLRNQQATHDAILRAIDKHLTEPAAKGDVVLFYYSGHGSQVENSQSDELDKRDETIVPADSALGAPDIRDKELAKRFNILLDHGVKLTVVLDSCHSGSGVRGLPGDAIVRAVSPDLHDVHDPARPPAPESRGALVLAATQDFARAYELSDENGNHHGVFSWALLRAMHDTVRGESAADTFLRAQALMRAESPFQDPVMAGDDSAQSTPLLRAGAGDRAEGSTVAVERILPDGEVVLEGGWAHGLTVGTELRPNAPADAALRIRVTSISGLTRSKGRVIGGGGGTALRSGMLLEIATWAAPEGRLMRVWIPQAEKLAPALRLAAELCEEASKQGVGWVDDPTEVTPTHVLRWRGHDWELVTAGAGGARAPDDAAAIVARIPPKSRLFVQLPMTVALRREIVIGAETEHNSVEETKSPEHADYVLVGRAVRAGVEYAWVRPEMHQDDAGRSALPPRTDWIAPTNLADAGLVLQHAILQLHKIMAWHLLESPPDSPSPYRLTLLRPEDRAAVRDGRVIGFTTYLMVLRAAVTPLPAGTKPRYFYVFGIDSFGRSHLLFPRGGSVENFFPLERDGKPPAAEVPIGSVTVKPPYGLDTYVLLSSDEPIPNPSILQWSGVRTRGPKGTTQLEELLSRTGGSSRAMEAAPTSAHWSIDRTTLQSVAPE